MLVRDLIDELQQYDGDAEVRLAMQPSWSFEYSISDVHQVEPGEGYEVVRDGELGAGWMVLGPSSDEPDVLQDDFESVEDAETWLNDYLDREGENESVVYLSEGTQLGYLPGAARVAIGW